MLVGSLLARSWTLAPLAPNQLDRARATACWLAVVLSRRVEEVTGLDWPMVRDEMSRCRVVTVDREGRRQDLQTAGTSLQEEVLRRFTTEADDARQS